MLDFMKSYNFWERIPIYSPLHYIQTLGLHMPLNTTLCVLFLMKSPRQNGFFTSLALFLPSVLAQRLLQLRGLQDGAEHDDLQRLWKETVLQHVSVYSTRLVQTHPNTNRAGGPTLWTQTPADLRLMTCVCGRTSCSSRAFVQVWVGKHKRDLYVTCYR